MLKILFSNTRTAKPTRKIIVHPQLDPIKERNSKSLENRLQTTQPTTQKNEHLAQQTQRLKAAQH
jgi:hypothetical protein